MVGTTPIFGNASSLICRRAPNQQDRTARPLPLEEAEAIPFFQLGLVGAFEEREEITIGGSPAFYVENFTADGGRAHWQGSTERGTYDDHHDVADDP